MLASFFLAASAALGFLNRDDAFCRSFTSLGEEISSREHAQN